MKRIVIAIKTAGTAASDDWPAKWERMAHKRIGNQRVSSELAAGCAWLTSTAGNSSSG